MSKKGAISLQCESGADATRLLGYHKQRGKVLQSPLAAARALGSSTGIYSGGT